MEREKTFSFWMEKKIRSSGRPSAFPKAGENAKTGAEKNAFASRKRMEAARGVRTGEQKKRRGFRHNPMTATAMQRFAKKAEGRKRQTLAQRPAKRLAERKKVVSLHIFSATGKRRVSAGR